MQSRAGAEAAAYILEHGGGSTLGVLLALMAGAEAAKQDYANGSPVAYLATGYDGPPPEN